MGISSGGGISAADGQQGRGAVFDRTCHCHGICLLLLWSIFDGELDSIDELLAKSSLLADFKAVKDGNVWCTGQNLFQETMGLATMIEDIHTMLTSDDPKLDSLTYMKKLK